MGYRRRRVDWASVAEWVIYATFTFSVAFMGGAIGAYMPTSWFMKGICQ